MKKIYIALLVLLAIGGNINYITAQLPALGGPGTFGSPTGTTVTYAGPVSNSTNFSSGAVGTNGATVNLIDLGASSDGTSTKGGLNYVFTNSSWGTCNFFGITYSNINITDNTTNALGISGWTGTNEYHHTDAQQYINGAVNTGSATAGLGIVPTFPASNQIRFTGTAWVPYITGNGTSPAGMENPQGTYPGSVEHHALVNVRVTISAYTTAGVAIPWIVPTGATQAVFRVASNFYVNVLYETDQFGMCNAMASTNDQQYCAGLMCNPAAVPIVNSANSWYPSAWLWKSRHGVVPPGTTAPWTSTLNMIFTPQFFGPMLNTPTAPTVATVIGCSPLSLGAVSVTDATIGVPGNNTYSWSYTDVTNSATLTGAGTTTNSFNTGTVTDNTTTAQSTGNLKYTVTSGGGCVQISNGTLITVRAPILATITPTIGGAICTNGTDPTYTVTPTGGAGGVSGGYTYQWQYYQGCGASSTFANVASGTVTPSSGAATSSTYTPPSTLSCQQFYHVVVTDNGSPACPAATAATVNQPVYPTVPAPTPTTTATTGICNSGSTTVTATGMAPSVTALQFTAANGQYMNGGAGTGFNLTTNFTIEAWINQTALNGFDQIIFCKENSFEARVSSSGTLDWAYGNTSPGWAWISTGYVIPTNTWIHVAIVYNGTAGFMQTYVNGNLVHSYPITGSVAVNGNPFWVGNRSAVSNSGFNGMIDEVRVWNNLVSQADLRNWLYKGITSSHTNWSTMVAYYKFDNNVNDSKGTNTGALAGSPAYVAPNYFTYTWTFTGATSAVATPSAATTGTTTETISLVLSNASSAEQTLTAAVYAKTPAGCDLSSPATGSTTIKVEPLPSMDQPSTPLTQCPGDVVSIPLTTSSGISGITYTWTNSNTAIGLTSPGSGTPIAYTAANTGGSAITSNIVITPNFTSSGVTCSGNTKTVGVTVNAKPIINTQPADVPLCGGGSATFTVVATATGIGYTWYESSDNGATYSLITNGGTAPAYSGQGTASLTLTNVPAAFAGTYYYKCLVSGTCSAFNIYTNPAHLIVSTQAQLSSSLTPAPTCSGTTFTYTATSATTGASFFWTRAAVTGISNAAITTEQTSNPITEVLNNTTNAAINVAYAYRITSTGCPNYYQTVTVPVNPTPSIADKTTTICSAGTFTISPTNGTDIVPVSTVYTWSAPSVAGITGTASGTNAANISGTLTNTTNAPIDVVYSVSPIGPDCTGSNFNVTVTVNPTATVNAVAPQYVCNGSTEAVTFGSPTTGGSIVYNWTNSNTAINLGSSGSGNISFAATNGTSAPISGNISVTPAYTYNSVTCNGTALPFTITVNPTATVTAVSNQTICNGDLEAVTFASPTTGGSIVYNWTNSNTAINLGASGSGNLSFNGTNATTSPISGSISVTPAFTNGNTCNGTAMNFTITVNPTATVNAVSNQTVCNGANTTAINFGTTATGYTSIAYNWTNNTTSVGLAASGVGNIAAFAGTNNGTAPVTATITVTPAFTYNGITCNGTPLSFTITVNPTATVNAVAAQYVCAGATEAVTFGSPTTGGSIVYNWTNSNTAINLGASGSGNLSFSATNTTSAPISGNISVTPAYTYNSVTCNGTALPFTITVNPTATVNAVSDQTVCKNGTVAAVTFGSPTTGGSIVYNWTNNNTATGLAASGAGNIGSFTGTNTGTAPAVSTVTVTPAYTNGTTCNGTPITYSITVNPLATVTTVSNQTLCNNATTTAINFASPTTGGSIVYNWTNNNTTIGLAASGTGNIGAFTATNTTTAPVTATITVTPTYTNNSVSCTGTATSFTITVNPTNLIAPVALGASPVTCYSFQANWDVTNTSAYASGYLLDVSTSPGFSTYFLQNQSVTPGSANSYQVTGLTQGTSYYYRVRAVYPCGNSAYSNTIVVVSAAVGTPTVPGGFTAAGVSNVDYDGYVSTAKKSCKYYVGNSGTGQTYSTSPFPDLLDIGLPAGTIPTTTANTIPRTVSGNNGTTTAGLTYTYVIGNTPNSPACANEYAINLSTINTANPALGISLNNIAANIYDNTTYAYICPLPSPSAFTHPASSLTIPGFVISGGTNSTLTFSGITVMAYFSNSNVAKTAFLPFKVVLTASNGLSWKYSPTNNRVFLNNLPTTGSFTVNVACNADAYFVNDAMCGDNTQQDGCPYGICNQISTGQTNPGADPYTVCGGSPGSPGSYMAIFRLKNGSHGPFSSAYALGYSNNSAAYSPAYAADVTPPTVVTGFGIQSGSSTNSQTWVLNASTDEESGVSAYEWSYSYTSNSGSPTVVTSTTPTYTFSGLTCGQTLYVKVRVKDCAGNATAYSAELSAPTLQYPVAAGTISGTATVCQGQNNVSYSVPAINNATSYIWAYSGSGATISGSTNPMTINFSGNATSGNLTVMGHNACGDGTISAIYPITVNPTPNVSNFTTTASTPVCSGGVSTVTIGSTTLVNGTYTATYNLSAPNAATGLTASFTISSNSGTFSTPVLNNTGTTTVTITSVANATSCSSTPSSGNTAGVVVNAGPVVTITGAVDVCVGGQITLTAGVTGGGGSITDLTWQRRVNAGSWGNVQSGTGTSYLTDNTLVTGSYDYEVILTQSGANCSATSSPVSANVADQPHILSDPTGASICKGGTVVLSAAASGGTPSTLYQWEYAGSGIVTNNSPTGVTYSGETGNTLTISTDNTTTPPGITSYWLTVYATGIGCNAVDVVTSTTADVIITADPVVSNPAPATQPVICSGGTPATISVTASGGTGTILYQWYSNTSPSNTGGTLISGANSAGYDPPATPGTTYYYCEVHQAASGCGPVTTALTAEVTVGGAVTATVVEDECMSAAAANKYYVLVYGSGGTAPYTYWDGNNNPQFYMVTTTTPNEGVFEVDASSNPNTFTVKDANNCMATTTPVNVPAGAPVSIVLTNGTVSATSTVDCYVGAWDKWVTFREAPPLVNNALIAINPGTSNLGLVTVTTYKEDAAPVIWSNQSTWNCTWTQHTAMRRHFKVTTDNAPNSNGVGVRLFFTEQEFQDLKGDAWNNNIAYPNAGYACTQLDDVYSFSGQNPLFVTKYTDPNPGHATENGNYLDNLPSGIYKVYSQNTVTQHLTPGQYTGAGTGFQDPQLGYTNGDPDIHYVELNVSEFSEFWLHGSQQSEALPVEMIYLQADAVNNAYIQVSWATATEVNNAGFAVERSMDGQTWSQIGWVDGHNNATSQNNYSFNDMNVVPDVVYYYRLKQVDNDGAIQYTDIVSARLSGEVTFSVKDFVPNPTMDKTSLIITATKDQEIRVTFYDVIGQKMMESSHEISRGGNRIEFDLGKLAAGTYTAVVSSANEVYSKKVVLTK